MKVGHQAWRLQTETNTRTHTLQTHTHYKHTHTTNTHTHTHTHTHDTHDTHDTRRWTRTSALASSGAAWSSGAGAGCSAAAARVACAASWCSSRKEKGGCGVMGRRRGVGMRWLRKGKGKGSKGKGEGNRRERRGNRRERRGYANEVGASEICSAHEHGPASVSVAPRSLEAPQSPAVATHNRHRHMSAWGQTHRQAHGAGGERALTLMSVSTMETALCSSSGCTSSTEI